MIQFKLGSVVLACGAAGGVGISLQGDDDNTAYGDKLDTIPEGTFPPNECEFEDSVILGVQTGGFEVEKDDGAFKLEEHAALTFGYRVS